VVPREYLVSGVYTPETFCFETLRLPKAEQMLKSTWRSKRAKCQRSGNTAIAKCRADVEKYLAIEESEVSKSGNTAIAKCRADVEKYLATEESEVSKERKHSDCRMQSRC
jgi:hypothetical protein